MKKTRFWNLILAAVAVACLVAACRQDDPAPIKKPLDCPKGYISVGDSVCKCPDGNYHLRVHSLSDTTKICRPLKKNEYYGIAYGCICPDTFFMDFPNGFDKDTLNLVFTTQNSFSNKSVVFYKYSTLTGDSLAAEDYEALNRIGYPFCQYKDNNGGYFVTYGYRSYIKMNPNRSTLRFHYTYIANDMTEPIENCDIIFRK